MANIIVKKDPYGIDKQQFYVEGSINLAQWMTFNLPPDNGLHCEITLNGNLLASTVTMTPEQCNNAIDVTIGLFDQVSISYRPQGMDPFTLFIIAVVVIGTAAAVYYMMPKPNLPGTDNDPRDSNNQLNAARNAYRPRLAIPDIAGEIVSYPDFIQPSYYVYENNQRVFNEWFCFGIGRYDVSTVKEGDTPFADIPGYSYRVIQPGESVGALLNVRTNESSVDTELSANQNTKTFYIGPDQDMRINALTSTIHFPPYIPDILQLQVGDLVDFDITLINQQGMEVSEVGTNVSVVAVDMAAGTLQLNFAFTHSGFAHDGFILNKSQTLTVPWYVLDGSEITEVWFNVVMPQGIRDGDNTATVAFTLQIEKLNADGTPTGQTYQKGGQFVGKTQKPQRRTIKFNAADGMQPGRYRAKIQRITGALGENAIDMLVLEGVSAVTPYANPLQLSLSAFVLIESNRFYLGPFTQAQLNALNVAPGDLLQIVISAQNINSTLTVSSIQPDAPGQFDLVFNTVPAGASNSFSPMATSITNLSKQDIDFGNVTLLNVIRRDEQRVNKGSSDKINAVVTRKLRIYNPVTGVYGSEYVASRRFCDYAFYLLHERMGAPIEQINIDELFGIADNLSDQQLGYFDFSFADGNVSARERLEACCNVARVRYWNEGLMWSFVRIERKPFKSLMFNRRNLKAGAANFTQNFRRPADPDSVTVVYVDPVKNAEKRVSRRITSTGDIMPGEGIRTNEIKLNGCRNDAQALNRCELEVRRLIHENVKVTDTALNDAQLCRLGQRVDWVDILDSDIFDGEVLAIDGDTYSTSERFTPKAGEEYWVYITDDQGTPSNSVRCYPVANNQFAFTASGLTGGFIAGGLLQLGSRYLIASNNDMHASSFSVAGRGRPNEQGECELELTEYSDQLFDFE